MKLGAIVQYDLFGEVEAAEHMQAAQARAASAAASQFLFETPWPDLLSWWLHGEVIEERLTRGEASASFRRGPGGGAGLGVGDLERWPSVRSPRNLAGICLPAAVVHSLG
ncbi:Uncharacterised protein [Mycobacteroides abscessus subsp. abscessus]|uniref:hypothetical protein n=1 Tax=Mycobacteroides abscessus TaxID=36809 RepID=UPI00092B4B96|nr:hypothetical protein [Mycobacteroides abscessus]SHX98845.1 Uncharacterised protein [Mycobacteroides abscessus subsp. abscessus]SIC80574.1 Uncharacterised protein [Mycobacteroides abscessus subsp. abscessus]SKP25987.1 Uncharacterised protein [Mycobacteroides abscessus subsp. abscessus]